MKWQPNFVVIAIIAVAAIWTLFALKNGFDYGVFDEKSSKVESSSPSPAISSSSTESPAAAAAAAAADGDSLITTQHGNRLLILYVYSESENGRTNLQFFIRHGLHNAADFVFIFNGETNATVFIPERPNIRIIERENTCFDLGASGMVLRQDELWKNYDYFIIMNASIRGPFLPNWSGDCWSDLFLARITDRVKLVGMSAICWPRFHVQSMIWATDRVGIALLMDPELGLKASAEDMFGTPEDVVGLNGCYTYFKAIHAEVGSTTIITNAGFEVDVMMTSFRKVRSWTEYCETVPPNVDVQREGDYFGFSIHPFETIFMKSNRNITPLLVDHFTSWVDEEGYSSLDKCKKTRGQR